MTKWWIYEFHILEPRNEGHEEIDEKKIIAVKDATYAVAKKKLENFQVCVIRTLSRTTLVQSSNQSQLKSERIIRKL